MPRLLHVTVLEGTGLVQHKETYVAVELLDITGRPIKGERAKTQVRRRREREREINYHVI